MERFAHNQVYLLNFVILMIRILKCHKKDSNKHLTLTLSRVTVTAAQPLMSIFMILICQMTLFLEVLGCVHRFRWLRMNFE